MTNKARLTFYGGVGSVTGANFMLEDERVKLLVDCGMFQGKRMCDDSNHEPFPYAPETVDALLVTHAHIDHIGRIPKLVKDGFKGTIYSTAATKELAKIMLDDAVKLAAEEAKQCGSEPPYDPEDVAAAFASEWKTVSYHEPFSLGDMSIEFLDAGHILGSSVIAVTHPVSGKIVFSGDLGNSPSLLLPDTEMVTDADYMVIESVYGDRAHEPEGDRSARIEDIVERIVRDNGTLLIPAFSVERTQLLLYEINNLVERHRIPKVPVFLDSPLAIKATEIYKRHSDLFNEASKAAIKGGDDIFNFEKLTFVTSHEASKELAKAPGAKIIIAGSGMSHGGRILTHEKAFLPDPKNVILIVGYQSPGSIGRQLVEGASSLDIHGERIPVKARVETIYAFSGHRDVNGLISFVDATHRTLKKLFVVMGEPKSSQFFAQRVRDYIGVDARWPALGETVEL